MDQVKEYLRLAVKYRFWIAVGIAALLPLIGFFIASGPIQAEEQQKASTIKSSFDNVKKFESRAATPVNGQYKPAVDKETALLKKDVDTSWRKLYERQAPLLTWPDEVADTIPIWTRKYPEELAPNVVRDAVTAYIETYEPYVESVYRSFNPFDAVTGKGIIAAPPKEALLQPAVFTLTTPPSLGKVWAAQERLWVQGTVLDVLAKVNERAGATSWIEAPLKQVLELQVATDAALDQQSLAEGKALTEAPDVLSAAETAAAAAAVDTSTTGAATDMMSMMGAQGRMGMAGGFGMSGGAAVDPAVVKYLESANADQVFIAPFFLSVYIEQDAITNLLAEFQNSPMNIQIREIGILKPPPHSVKKPVKGVQMQWSMGFGMGRGGSMMGDMFAGGYGGSYGAYMAGGRSGMAGGGMMDMGQYMRGQGGGMGAYGMGGMRAPAAEKRKGVSVVEKTVAKREAKRKAEEEKAKQEEETESLPQPETGPDPYFDIVEVRIYGQARFYKTPPAEETVESESELAGAAQAIDAPAPSADSTAPAASVPPTSPAPSPATSTSPTAAPESTVPAPDAGDAPAPPPAEDGAEPRVEGEGGTGEKPETGPTEAPKPGSEPTK